MPFWVGGNNRRNHSGNGLPNRKPSKLEAGLVQMSSMDYNANRHRGRMKHQKWNGSPEQKEIKGGTWFGWGKKR